MLFNILHAEERKSILDEAWRVLRPSGKLAIIHSLELRRLNPQEGQARVFVHDRDNAEHGLNKLGSMNPNVQ